MITAVHRAHIASDELLLSSKETNVVGMVTTARQIGQDILSKWSKRKLPSGRCFFYVNQELYKLEPNACAWERMARYTITDII